MTIVFALEGDKLAIDSAVDLLMARDDEFCPTHFGTAESNVRRRMDASDGNEDFAHFLEANRLGYFLRSPRAKYNVSFSETRRSSIFVEFQQSVDCKLIDALVKDLALAKPDFGFACDYDERRHRNKLVVDLDSSSIEGWVGRDISKYIPGVYWITLISRKLLDTHSIELGRLKNAATDNELIDSDVLYLKFFDSPHDWRKLQATLDGICRETNGMFSRSDISGYVSTIKNRMEFVRFVNSWA